jgi:hypothetical protein
MGKLWAKLVVPSRGSTNQRYSEFALVPASLFRHDAVAGEVRAQAFDDQLFAGAVGFRYQVEITLEFEPDAPLEIMGQQRPRLACDIDRRFEE